MTDKNILKQKLEETKAKIKSNSKDAHFADALIAELLGVDAKLRKADMGNSVILGDIEKEYDGGNFKITAFRDGSVMYHTTGGYTVIGDYRLVGLNAVLRDFIDKMTDTSWANTENRENTELDLSANTYILNVPMFAFSDVQLKFELATKVIEYLNNLYKTATEAEIAEEDIENNKVFHDAVMTGKYADEDRKKSKS